MDEKRKILEMVQNGTITAEEGVALLDALDKQEESIEQVPKKQTRTKKKLHIKVDNRMDESRKVDITIPLTAAKWLSKFTHMMPEHAKRQMEEQGVHIEDLDIDGLMDALDEDPTPIKLVDISTEDAVVQITVE